MKIRTMRAMSRSIMVVDIVVEEESRGRRALPRAMMEDMESILSRIVKGYWVVQNRERLVMLCLCFEEQGAEARWSKMSG